MAVEFIQGDSQSGRASRPLPVFAERRKSLAIPPAICCTAKAGAFTESSFIFGRTSSNVRVLRIWHASRGAITAADVED
jgi:hypothetical protein